MKKRVIGRILGYGLAGVLALCVLAAGLLYVYQDTIIGLFVAEANKHIKTKVEVGKISVSWLDKFPQVSVTLEEVKIMEGLPESSEALAHAQKMFCTFSLSDMLRGRYQVRQFFMENGEVYVKVLPDGQVNYLIVESDTTAASEDFAFQFEKITLSNVDVTYIDQQLKQRYEVKAREVEAALAVEPQLVRIRTQGDLRVETISIEQQEYFKGKDVVLHAQLDVDMAKELIRIAPSLVQVGKASYELGGSIGYAAHTELDLKLEGKNTNIQSLLSLLPQKITSGLSQYRSDGDVYFSGQIKGTVSDKSNPLVSFRFGCRNASFYHPDYKQKLERISLEGSFTNGARHNTQTSVLELKNLKGVLKDKPFSGSLVYRNFQDPAIELDAQAELDIAHVLGLFPVENIRNASGTAAVKVAFSGNLKKLKASPNSYTFSTKGDISLRNVHFTLKDYPLPFTGLSGDFQFRKNDLAVSGFRGKLGLSDFAVNGLFRNALAWLLLPNQPLLLEADFDSDYLDFDQLLSAQPATLQANVSGAGGGASAAEYQFAVSPLLAFDVNATIGRLQFRRFRAKKISGQVRLKNQVITTPGISLLAAGGRFSVSGSVDARRRNHIRVATDARLAGMQVDSLFYVFEDFGQEFIQQRHLRGHLTASINSELFFDQHLNPLPDQMQAEIQASMRNGQLLSFEPMQKLSAFASRAELANLQFSELSNSFWIQNRTVYIPEMEIKSNVSKFSSISVSGMHTFDQHMNYRFRIPLPKNRRPDKDEAYGAVEETSTGNSNLFLTLKGTEDNYKIGYDKERVAGKIKDDLKKEKQELLNVLHGQKPEEKKKKDVELKQGDYFDF